jgi:hypothetical protein
VTEQAKPACKQGVEVVSSEAPLFPGGAVRPCAPLGVVHNDVKQLRGAQVPQDLIRQKLEAQLPLHQGRRRGLGRCRGAREGGGRRGERRGKGAGGRGVVQGGGGGGDRGRQQQGEEAQRDGLNPAAECGRDGGLVAALGGTQQLALEGGGEGRGERGRRQHDVVKQELPHKNQGGQRRGQLRALRHSAAHREAC